jgi:hypothetical protein
MQAVQLAAIACKRAPANRVNLLSKASGNEPHRGSGGVDFFPARWAERAGAIQLDCRVVRASAGTLWGGHCGHASGGN